MSCLSIVSQELYDKTLEGITEAAELRGIERFQPVVQGNYDTRFVALPRERECEKEINYHFATSRYFRIANLQQRAAEDWMYDVDKCNYQHARGS